MVIGTASMMHPNGHEAKPGANRSCELFAVFACALLMASPMSPASAIGTSNGLAESRAGPKPEHFQLRT